jgi:hypothetical protein
MNMLKEPLITKEDDDNPSDSNINKESFNI